MEAPDSQELKPIRRKKKSNREHISGGLFPPASSGITTRTANHVGSGAESNNGASGAKSEIHGRAGSSSEAVALKISDSSSTDIGMGLFPTTRLSRISPSNPDKGVSEEIGVEVADTSIASSMSRMTTRSTNGVEGAGVLVEPDSSYSYEQEDSISPLFPKISYPSEASIQRTRSYTNASNVEDFSSWLRQEQSREDTRRRASSSATGAGTSVSKTPSMSDQSSHVLELVDDAASSICIDEEDDGTEMRKAIIEVLRGQQQRKTNLVDDEAPPEPLSDFDEYTQRIARELVVREKVERRMMRRVKDSRKYGNYFSNANDTGTYYAPSHHYDNFNGRRQNIIYNNQLNELNTPYTYEERQRRRERGLRPQEDDMVIEEMPDEVSMITLDIDELESDDLSLTDYGKRDDDVTQKPRLRRKLLSRHVQLLSLGGTLGVGAFFNSSQTFFQSGPFGTLLGYVISGLMVLSAMLSLGEMVALLPSDRGISSFPARFVDASFGFALGICYWFSCVMALPSEVTAASMLISNYPMLNPENDNSIVVWITFFLILVLLVNMFDVGMLGELQSIASLAIFCCIILLMLFLALANNGKVGPYHERLGFRYWDYSKSNFTTHQVYGLFRPNYALGVTVDTTSQVTVISSIGGNIGRFLQVWSAIVESAFSYIGTELVFTTAAEVRNPRKSIPAATKKIFWRILICFCLGIFMVSINVYAGDPRLMKLGPFVFKLDEVDGGTTSTENAIKRVDISNITNFVLGRAVAAGVSGFKVPNAGENDITASPPNTLQRCHTTFWSWSGFSGSSSSPWIIALQGIGSCSIAASTNALFIVCALSSCVSHLYAASRTLYGLALQIQNEYWIWGLFRRCSNAGVPYVAVLCSFVFALLAYMTSNATTAKAFEWLVTLCTSAGLLVWAGCCLSFIRFERALKLRPSIVQRDDEGYPFRSPFQPYTAYFGLVSSLILVFFLGLTLFLKGQWNTGRFFASYSAIFVFIVCYTLHKLRYKTSLVPIGQVDLDSGRKEVENVAWEEDRVYSPGLRDWARTGYATAKYYMAMLKKKSARN
ncbi:Ssy1p [Sugiyamaella lignohabitans]|uniref:Ssy1p n=1 Tax=Sugiyamaella lignohabitans TaxID=796027 RepID=A0A167CBC4_9ASCO|nr:Ssy1p [Sugiyamaella lignohabitans]ANB11463.1 Ssy1p [Sugiyamaella lignohabitans]